MYGFLIYVTEFVFINFVCYVFHSELCFKIQPHVIVPSHFCLAFHDLTLIHFLSTNEYHSYLSVPIDACPCSVPLSFP